MSKKPSAETQLREVRRELKHARNAVLEAVRGADDARTALLITRGQVTKAQQDAADWRKRFDDLLARVPLKPIGDVYVGVLGTGDAK